MAFESGLLPNLFQRELNGYNRNYAPNQFSHAFTCQGQHAGVIRVDPDGDPCPPYAVAYNQVVNGCRFLTVGDEEGSVSIVDTWSNQLPSSLYTDHDTPPRAKWLAHNNAIFDVAWAKNDSILYTASGDQHVGVWDTTAGRLLYYCAGHLGSVKAVCPHSVQPDMFASGSRDGGILLWDLRSPSRWSAAKRRMQLSPVMRIDIATAPGQQYSQTTAAAGGFGSNRSTPGTGKKQSRLTSGQCRRSVTSLLFVNNEHTMISSSDMDGVVKLWDLRSLTQPTGDITLPAPPPAAAAGRQTGGRGSRTGGKQGGAADGSDGVCWLGFNCPSRSSRSAGITNMALSPSGGLLLVSSIDSCHYLYRLSGLHQPPVACLTGHRTNSFCIKSCFSPCGNHVLSGSSDKKAYIWEVSSPWSPPVCLSGHSGEVTAVAWCPADHCHVTTAADDATVRVWVMDRADSRYQRDYDQTNVILLGDDAGRQQLKQKPAAGDNPQQAAAAAAAVLSPSSVVTAGVARASDKARAVCSPATPQLPFWRSTAGGDVTTAAVTGQQPAAAAAETPSAANNAAAVYRTPAVNSHQVGATTPVPSLPPPHPTPTAARTTTPRLRQTTIQLQLTAAAAHKQAAIAAQPAPISGVNALIMPQQALQQNTFGSQQRIPASVISQQQSKQQQHHQHQHQQQQHTTPIELQQPDVLQQVDHLRATTREQSPAATGDCVLFVAGDSRAAPSGQQQQQQDFTNWMNALTPSPTSSPELEQQQQQNKETFDNNADLDAGLCLTQRHQRQQQQSCRVSFKRGGVVELSTPWELPSPVRQQRQHEQALLEAQHLQQSQLKLRGLTLQEGASCPDSSSSQPDGVGADDDGDVGVNCCRLLQDEFEVYCDGDRSPPAAAAAGMSSRGTAATQRSLSCQENKSSLLQQQQMHRGLLATAGLGSSGVVIISQADVDMVPCSLPPCTTQSQPQQQQSSDQPPGYEQIQGVRSPTRHAARSPAGPTAGGDGGGEGVMLLNSANQPGGAELLSGGQRTPLADLSRLLPAEPDPLSPDGQHRTRLKGSPAAAAAGSPARRILAGGGADDSPMLQMLLHGRNACGQHGQGVSHMLNSPERQLQCADAAGHQGLLSTAMRHSSPAGRRLSRLGDRQISPLPAVQLMPARTVQQQRQQQSGAAADVMYMVHITRQEPDVAVQQQGQLPEQHQEGHGEAGVSGDVQERQQQQPGSSAGKKHGGIKRSYVSNAKDRKKQCTLSSLWVKEPEIEDAASRFSGF